MKKVNAKNTSRKKGWSYASNKRVKSHERLAVEFLQKILNLNYYDCFISDESRLTDFSEEDQFKEDVIKKIKRIYNEDISDIFDKPLVDIFDKLTV